MSPSLQASELTKLADLIVKANLDLCEADIRFLKYCRGVGYGKLTGVLIKAGVVVMADVERRDVRFDIKSGT